MLFNTNTAKDLIWTNQNYEQLASTIMRWFIGMLEFRKQELGEEEGARSGQSQSRSSKCQDQVVPSEAEDEGSEQEPDFVVDIQDDHDFVKVV